MHSLWPRAPDSAPRSKAARGGWLGAGLGWLQGHLGHGDGERTVNERIFWAAAITASISLGAKVLAIGRESLVARQFGRSKILDAYLIALVLPEFLINLVAGSFSSAFIPSFIAARATRARVAQTQLLSSAVTASAAVLVLLSLVLCVGAPYYLPWLARGFGAAELRTTRHLVYSLAPYLALSGAGVVFTAVLNAEERFALPAVSSLLPPVFAVILLLTSVGQLGIYVLSVGLGAGTLAQCLLLAPAVRRRYPGFRVAWHGADHFLRQMGRQYLPMLAGAFLLGSATLVDQALATLLPTGSVAALAYANRVVIVIMSLATVSLSSALLPYFSKQIATLDWDGCRHTLSTWLKWVTAVSVVGTAILIAASQPLIRILYQRGAFTAADTAQVSHIQIALALQMPFFMAGILFVRLLSALQANQFLLWGAVVALPVDVALDLVFMHFWGIVGIALATSCMYAATCATEAIFAVHLLRRRSASARMAGQRE